MKPRAIIVIVAIAILALAVVAWNRCSHESLGGENSSTDRNRKPSSEGAASSGVSQSASGFPQSKSKERDETPSNRRRTAHVTEAITTVAPQGKELLRNWELKSHRPLGFANTLLQKGASSAAAIVLPPPDEEAEGELRDLLLAEIDDSAFALTSSEIEKLKDAIGWPSHSRVIVAETGSDGEDSVMVIEDADEKSVSVDPVTGDVSFNSSSSISVSELDLDTRNRFSHLFGVKSEE